MELPPLIQRLITAVPTLKEALPTSIVKLDSSLSGTLLDAIIEQRIPITEGQKQSLIKALQAQLGQRPPNSQEAASTTSKPPADIFQSLHTKLYTAVLDRGQHSEAIAKLENLPNRLLLLTDVTLNAGSKIQTKIRDDGNLQLISTPSPTNSRSSAITHHTAPPEPQPPKVLMQTALRRYIPFKHDAPAALNAAHMLWEALNTLPMKQRDSLIDRAAWRALTNIVNHATLRPQIQHHSVQFSSEAIRKQVVTSGNYLEPSLTKQTGDKGSLGASIEKDTKAQLLTLYAATQISEAVTAQERSSASTSLQSVLKSAASQLRSLEPLLKAINQLNQNTQPLNFPDVKRLIGRTLTAAAAIGIARISANQLQQLLNTAEAGSVPTAHQVELSLRIQEQILPVSLYLQAFPEIGEKEQDYKKQGRKQEDKETQSRWQVFMELELPENGWFAAEVSFQGERVTTRLWSERDEIKQRAQARLSSLKATLQAQGLEVDDIRLENGSPPVRQQAISQSLVDVRT